MHLSTQTEMRSTWPVWADIFRHRGLEGLVSWVLEAAGPITLLGAQFLHFGTPFLRPYIPETQLLALSSLLEDNDEGLAFISYLKEERTTG